MNAGTWHHIGRLSLLCAVAPGVIALGLLWLEPEMAHTSRALRWTLTALVVGCATAGTILIRERLTERLRTFTNILNAVREDDYSVRAAGAGDGDPISELAQEVNLLVATLREAKLHRREIDVLLSKVLSEIDVGLFAFDERDQLRLVSPVGARWLARAPADIYGANARALGVTGWLEGDTPRIEELVLPGIVGRFQLRRSAFRDGGRRHQLIVVSDLSRALADEERQAWKRLLNVLRHEVNNSLAPIQSMAGTLTSKLSRRPRPDGWEDDVLEGLDVIESRARALGRLITAYAQLTRLPPPTPDAVDVRAWVERTIALEERLQVTIQGRHAVTIQADPDQLDQLLINLVRNAVDAALTTAGSVTIDWRIDDEQAGTLLLMVEDEGPGIVSGDNLFVPFFTTKPDGSGIGLVLSRQIAEAHGGSLRLSDRRDRSGCRAELRLPIDGAN